MNKIDFQVREVFQVIIQLLNVVAYRVAPRRYARRSPNISAYIWFCQEGIVLLTIVRLFWFWYNCLYVQN